MKNCTRLLCLLLALVLFAGMALGSTSSDNEGGSPIETTKGDSSTVGSNEPEKTVTIEEQVLLDQDGVKITAKEFTKDMIWGYGIKVLIENTTDQNLGINCNALIVNNYMITSLFSASVAAGKKSNETIYLSSTELESAGIENIGQIELSFHVYNSDSYDTVFDADLVTVKTSAFEEMDVTPADAGTELLNQDGIRIVGKVVEEDEIWGTAVVLYLENTSGQNVTVTCEDMSVNGFMITPVFYSSIYDGKMALDEISILSTDLEENDITAVEEIELSFHVYNSETYETIVETDAISFTVG